ncbi:conserved hypothetical protein [Gammaproteobacteria bacterium]
MKFWRDYWFGIALLLPLPFWGLFYVQGWQPITKGWTLLLIAPVLEEVAFRGTIQTLLIRTSFGRTHYGLISGANLLTAFLFSLTHVIVHGNFFGLLTLFPGLIFGFFRERYQCLMPVIVLHGYYNAGLLLQISDNVPINRIRNSNFIVFSILERCVYVLPKLLL